MPEHKDLYPSLFLKANQNVKEGDIITIMDGGSPIGEGKDKRLQVGVEVERTKENKILNLNKTNYYFLCDLYGKNTDKWVGKKAKIAVVKARTPEGKIVDSILLILSTEEIHLDNGENEKKLDIENIPF